MLSLLTSHVLDLLAALASIFLGSVFSDLPPGLERLPTPTHLLTALAKIRAAREYDGASLFALSPEWNKKFLKTSMAHSTMDAHEHVRHLDHAGRTAASPSDKKQKTAT